MAGLHRTGPAPTDGFDMTDSAVAIGLIGVGIMGDRMLTAILAQPPHLVRAAGIWDPSPEAMARIAARHPELTRCRDAASLIAASDCVYVASPPASHLGHARAALAAGKTVFAEKPLAVDVQDARVFVQEAGTRGAVNFPFASSLGVAQLGRWLDEDAVGRPERVTIEVAFATWPRSWQQDAARWLDGRQEGGFTREVVSHFLFLTQRLVGPLHGMKAQIVYPGPDISERRVEASLMAGDVPVTLRGAVGETVKDDHNIWLLEGEAGAIRLCDWAIAERRGPDGAFVPAPDVMPNEQARPIALARQLQGVASLTRGAPHHLATLAEALAVQEIVEAILAS